MDIVARARGALAKRFPGAVIEVGLFYGAERVHGYMLWAGFESMEQIDRQQAVYEAIQDELGPDATRVSIILTYTPEEYALMKAA
ncbi:MAG TPA: hypothetical protein VFJ58_09660 [Armatimonadota bacterium]|nr:hypothetical protein [Armatimonadota bacterium]